MPADSSMEPDAAIAIVGIGGLFPGLRDTRASSGPTSVESVDATSEVPAGALADRPGRGLRSADRPGRSRLLDARRVRDPAAVRSGRDSISTDRCSTGWTRSFSSRSTSARAGVARRAGPTGSTAVAPA